MNKTYFDKIHKYGRISCLLSLVFFLCIPLAISLHFNVWPELSVVGKGLSALIIFFVTGIVEVVAYSPMLGAGGTYLSFVSGNIMNLKMPCAINAMENAKVKANTEEGEVITTIAIAASTITTTIIIAVIPLRFHFLHHQLHFPSLLHCQRFIIQRHPHHTPFAFIIH